MHSQPKARFPVGHTNFHNIKDKDLTLVDKTKLIIDIHENKNSKMFFISRPACFGKSTIISTLNHFYNHEKNEYGNFFDNSLVSESKEIVDKYHGKFTVINMHFLNLVTDNYSEFISAWKFYLRNLYSNFYYLKEHLQGSDLEFFKLIASEKTSDCADMEMALAKLCQFICDYNNQFKTNDLHAKPVILIDELDMPIHNGEIKGYFPEIYQNIKNMLTHLVETPEPVFEMAICTGIYPQTALFSSFKNISVYSSLQENTFSDAFGFTENEIQNILIQNNIDVESEYKKILEHYGHYYCGNQMVFRDWSVINAIKSTKVIYQDYFGDRETYINSLMMHLSETCTNLIKRLLKGHHVTSVITDQLYLSPPAHQLTFCMLKKDKESFDQKTRYAIFADEDNNWFYRYRDMENINNFHIENINKQENTNLYHFLNNNPLLSKKKNLAFNISLLNERYNFKTSLLEVLIKEKGLIHLDEKIWFISLFYASGFLTAIPFDNKNNSAELVFMIPNQEIYNFYIKILNLSKKEYPYIPRSDILQKVNCSKQIANLESMLEKHKDFYFQISKIQYSDKNERFISIQLLNKKHKEINNGDVKVILLDLLNAFSADLEQQGFVDGVDYDMESFNASKGRLKISSKNLSTLEFIALQLGENRQRHLNHYGSSLPFFSKKSEEKKIIANNDQHENICILQ